MFKKTFALLMIFSIILFACQSDDSNAQEQEKKAEIKAETKTVYFTLLQSGLQSGITKAGDYIIDNNEVLDSMWKEHYSYLSLEPEPPIIDFGEDIVVAVFLGNKQSTGYWIRLDSVYTNQKAKEIIVAMTANESPDPEKETIQIATQPHFFAAIPKTEYDVKFDFNVVPH